MNAIKAKASVIDVTFIDSYYALNLMSAQFIRCMERLARMRKVTDIAELPAYLSDEDPRVVEAAKIKLEELTNGRDLSDERS